MRRELNLPVDVYVDTSSPCPNEAERIFALIDKAFAIHRHTVLRFLSEMGTGYDDLFKVQFRITGDKGSADVIFRVVDLPPPQIGGALISGEMLPHVVEIGCGMGRVNVTDDYRISTILHELYHTLGVGHTLACGDLGDLMCPVGYTQYYPSTLNLLAIHYRYFANPSLVGWMNYTMPREIPYVVVLPWSVTVSQFYAQMASLRDQIEKLKLKLDNDITYVTDEVRRVSRAVDNLWSSHIRLENEVKNLTASFHSAEGRMEDLKASLRSMTTSLETLLARLDILEAETRTVRRTIVEAVTISASLAVVAISISVAALRSTRAKKGSKLA